MTDEELEAIQMRVDAATPGPWREDTHGLSVIEGAPEGSTVAYDILRQEDLTFIVAARTDLPALLAEVRRLRGVLNKQLAIELHAAGLRDAVASLQVHLTYDLPEVERWRAALQDCIDDADAGGVAHGL